MAGYFDGTTSGWPVSDSKSLTDLRQEWRAARSSDPSLRFRDWVKNYNANKEEAPRTSVIGAVPAVRIVPQITAVPTSSPAYKKGGEVKKQKPRGVGKAQRGIRKHKAY